MRGREGGRGVGWGGRLRGRYKETPQAQLADTDVRTSQGTHHGKPHCASILWW